MTDDGSTIDEHIARLWDHIATYEGALNTLNMPDKMLLTDHVESSRLSCAVWP
jgi:hypothetical protein